MRVQTGLLLIAMALVAGCGRDANTKPAVGGEPPLPAPPPVVPGEKPKPLYDLPEPTVGTTVNGVDVSKLPAARLAEFGRAAAEQRPAEAMVYYFWSAKTRPGDLYNLACYTALAGKPDDALYWLQKAGLAAGVDGDWAARDPDLRSVRADRRWPSLLTWLRQCEAYHAANVTPLTTLIVPDGYDRKKGKPVTVIVWLHGMGSTPTGFVDPAAEDSLARALANELNVAFVGVSGTKVKGADRFVWAENAEADLARVTAALEEVKDRVTVTAGRVIAFGFSQGAQTGFELAARRPDLFAGAIVLSPGSDRENLGQIKEPSALLKQRGFGCGCGAREHPGNKLQARNGAEWAKAAGAKVDNQLFPNQSAHSFPEDINARFPQWVTFVLAANEKK